MLKRTGFALAAAGMLAVSAFAAVNSGLKSGAPVQPFDVVDVSGPNKGKQLCYRCSYGGNPVLAAFIKPGSPNAATIISGMQGAVEKHSGLKTFAVVMGGPETKGQIEKLTAEKKISIPVTFLPQGPSAADVSTYQINPSADNTILLWNKGKVQANFTNVDKASWGDVEKAAASMLK